MKIEPGKFCPLLKKDCIGLKCAWFTQVRGTDPQSGREVDEWACAVAWMPVLSINTANEVRQGAAATEGLRNHVGASGTSLQQQKSISNAVQLLTTITHVPDGQK